LELQPDMTSGQSDIPAAAVRAMLGPTALLGVSVKTKQEAADALAAGADYVGCGAVFPTATKVRYVPTRRSHVVEHTAARRVGRRHFTLLGGGAGARALLALLCST
jgi:thiamine-phosphate diphosphorylase